MDLSNYIDVPTRFAALLEKWPELRIKEHRPEIITVGDQIFISVTMQAWRTPDDPLPCQATCYEPFPGRTPFTKLAEQQNASTSCLGRLAGLMMSFPKMASLEEVINRQKEEQSSKPVKPWEASEGQRRLLRALGYAGEVPSGRLAFESLVTDLKAKKMTEGEAF
jgi:hypothetical protein